jgi:signal transduction histidine kinase
MFHLTYTWIKSRNIKLLALNYTQGIIYIFLLFGTQLIFKETYVEYNYFWIPSAGQLFIPWFILWLFTVACAHFPICKLYFSKKHDKKIQLKYFLAASIVGFVSGSLNFFLPFNFTLSEYGNFGISLYAIILTYAFLKHQILGIEIIVRKSIFYSMFIATLSGIYLILIILMEGSFRGIIGYKSVFISASAAFVISIIFNPLRNKIQTTLDKLFLGKTTNEFAKENELLKQELERSERLKAASTLALGLAHEIRNPLTTIKTFAEFLPGKYTDKDFINKFSKLIPAEVERINNIIHQLLTFSKPSPPSFKDTDIHGLIKDILGFLNSEFLKKKIRISEDYADSTLIIRIDPTQIKQALLNIVFNALDAMPNGGMLSMKTEITNDSRFKIRISDTGCGIAKEDLKHIFDPFYSKKDEGTGLGLAITHRIITNHGGAIEAESEMVKGTMFIITIPLTTKI